MILPPPPPAIQLPQSPSLPVLLTLDEAMSQFKQKGFDLLLADAAVQQAQGDLQANGALAPPVISFSAGHTKGYDPAFAGPGASDKSYGVGISDSNALSDLLWGKRLLRVRISEAAIQAAKLGRKDAERTLTTLLKEQYLQAALAQLNLTLTETGSQSAGRTLGLVEARYRAGAVSEADVARAKVGALEAEQSRDAAQQALRSAQAGLAFLLGRRGATPDFHLEHRLDHPEFEDAPPLDPARLDLEALNQRPDLLLAAAQERRAEAGLQLAHRNWAPDVTWSFNLAQEGTGQNALQPRTYTIGLAVPLPSLRRQRGEIAKAEADRRTQELQKAKAQAQVVQDVANAVAAVEAARKRLRRMEAGLLQAAQRSYELVSFQYEKGAATLLDVLDEKHAFELPPRMVENEFQVIWNQVEQERATGQLSEEDKDKSEEQLRAEYRRIAERRVRLGLVLAEIGRRNDVTVTEQEMNNALIAEARRYPGQEREVIEFYRQNAQAAAQLRAPVYEEKVVDLIFARAQVENTPVTKDELFAEDELPESYGAA